MFLIINLKICFSKLFTTHGGSQILTIQIKAEIEKIDALTPKFNELNSYVEELYNEVAHFAEHHFQATESNPPLNAFQVETLQASSNQPSDTFQTEKAELEFTGFKH